MTRRTIERLANVIAFGIGLGGMALLAWIIYLVETFA